MNKNSVHVNLTLFLTLSQVNLFFDPFFFDFKKILSRSQRKTPMSINVNQFQLKNKLGSCLNQFDTFKQTLDFQSVDNQSIWSFSGGKNQKMSESSGPWQLVRVDVQNPPRQNLTNLNRATNFTPQVVFLCKMRSKLKDFLLIMTNLTADKALLLDPHLFGGPIIQNLPSKYWIFKRKLRNIVMLVYTIAMQCYYQRKITMKTFTTIQFGGKFKFSFV